jgi:hypothetical protein
MASSLQLIFVAFCTGISIYAARLFATGRRSRTWPSVQGTITTSRVEKASLSGGSNSNTPILLLTYSYDVNGKAYTGQRIAFAPSGWFSLGSARQLHTKYPKGDQVTVFYSPAEPSLSTLVVGVPGHLWTFFLIVSMFAFLGLVSVLSLF